MSYAVFCRKIGDLVKRSGFSVTVRLRKDADDGRYIARFSDGTTIIGNGISKKVTVRFGSGHQAMAEI